MTEQTLNRVLKKNIDDLSAGFLQGKRVLVRVDFNVPIRDGVITDDARILAALPTIRSLQAKGAKVVLVTHLGRPDGRVIEDLRVAPLAKQLSVLLGQPVPVASDCIGDSVKSTVNALNPGDVLLLENVRFHKEETDNNPAFAKALSELADVFVQEAFGTVHRAHASTEGVAHFIPAVSGYLIQKELDFLDGAIRSPKRPLVAIIGGSKVSSKMGVLSHLLDKVDVLIIGGGMTFTFLLAKGFEIGKSLCEKDRVEEAAAFLKKAETSRTKVVFPVDQVVADSFSVAATTHIVPIDRIPEGTMGMDVGPETVAEIKAIVETAQTILWNGPLGVFEMEPFSHGTFAVARLLADSSAITIVGGGDSAAAIADAGLIDRMTHISTGGGASLEFLEGKDLPGITVLETK